MNVKKLKEILNKYPDNMEISNEQNQRFIHIVNIGDSLIISVEKPISFCERTGEFVYPTTSKGYSAFSPALDEDLYKMEFTGK